ncbi:hypothetical protein L5515_016532 [Caenorhabditis briggsae]|uniref:Uncharacterized protein n=1 Tax=Caenorhabditis briggsae TaxID=6238 RepID=A0AAE9FAW2_CAEBR|nr:hypothetical protein L5515_016532 [Caenorhabditis briggsae]
MTNHQSKSSSGFDGNGTFHAKDCKEDGNYFLADHYNIQRQQNGNREHTSSGTSRNGSKYYGEDGRQPPQFGAGWSKANGLRSESTASGEDRHPSDGFHRSQSKNRDRSRPREFGRGWSVENCKENDGGIPMKDAQGHGASDSGNWIHGNVKVGSRMFEKDGCPIGNISFHEGVHSGQYEARQQRTSSYQRSESNRTRVKSESAYSNATGRGASEDNYYGYQQEMGNYGVTNYHVGKKDSYSAANKSFNAQPMTKTRESSECDSRRSYSNHADVSYGWNEGTGYKGRLDSLEYHHKKWRSVSRHAGDNYRKENHPSSHQMDNHYGYQGMPSDGRRNSRNNSHSSNGSRHYSHGYNNQHHAGSHHSGSYNGPSTVNSRGGQAAFSKSALGHPFDLHKAVSGDCEENLWVTPSENDAITDCVYESELDDDVFEQVAAPDAEPIADVSQFGYQNATVDDYTRADSESTDTKIKRKFDKCFAELESEFEEVEPKRSTPCQVPMSWNVFKFGGDVYDLTEIGTEFDSFDIKADWRKPMTYPYYFNGDGWSDGAIWALTKLTQLTKSHDNLYAESANEWKDTEFNANKLRRNSEPYNLRPIVHKTGTDVSNAGEYRQEVSIVADPTWRHATRLPKATFPDTAEPLKYAGKYFAHDGVVSEMPFLHIQCGIAKYRSLSGALVPMPPNFQFDLIPTRTHPVGSIPSGIYQFVAKNNPLYKAFKSSNCIQNMQRVYNNQPVDMHNPTMDVFDSFMADIRSDIGSGKLVTRVAHVAHQANI